MNWNKLKDGMCPKCLSNLEETAEGHKCENEGCDFFITKARYNELIAKMIKSKPRRTFVEDEVEDNLSELNNLEI